MRVNVNLKNIRPKTARVSRDSGFTLIEAIIVLVVIAIMSAISLPYIFNYAKQYKSDDQGLKIMDMMREAGQLALVKRRTMRFEIDLTDNQALIIDTRGAGAGDDIQIKALRLESPSDLRVDLIPDGVTRPSPNYANAVFAPDTIGHLRGTTTVNGNSVWQAAFRSDGSVVNAANTPISANIYVWTPAAAGSTTAKNVREVRAITLFGGSGALRYWKHDGTNFKPF